MSVCLSVRSHVSKTCVQIFSPNFLYMLPVVVAWFFCDSNALCYVLPVLWMTSCFHIMERMGENQRRRVCFVEFARWLHQSDVRRRTLRRCLWSRSPDGGAVTKSAVSDCTLLHVIRSTPPSRPNNISGSQMSVRPSVRPSVHKTFIRFQ